MEFQCGISALKIKSKKEECTPWNLKLKKSKIFGEYTFQKSRLTKGRIHSLKIKRRKMEATAGEGQTLILIKIGSAQRTIVKIIEFDIYESDNKRLMEWN